MVSQRIRDPLHDLIEFDTERDEFEGVLWKVIQTRPFQRLRRIKQLGFSDLVYPGATHSRFAHSIGVFHTARMLMDVIRKHVTKVEDSKMRQALAAALVHDLGHGPFSHAFEGVGKRLGLRMADHEHVSDVLIRDSDVAKVLNELGSGFADDVADIIRGRGKKNVYRAVVSSQFDADRLDYMRRDRLMTGTQHAAIDFKWLIANLQIANVAYGVDQSSIGEIETFVLGPKAIFGAEAYVLGLFQLYPTVYFHKATRGAEKLFGELLYRTITLIQNDSLKAIGLPDNHPIVRFAWKPDDVESALALDDTSIWGALPLMCDASDAVVASLAQSLRNRELGKCIDIREKVAHSFEDSDNADEEIVACCARIKEKLTDWMDSQKTDMPPIYLDEAQRSPYKTVEESQGPLDRINIYTNGGKLVDLKQRSAVVAAVKPFKLFRVYSKRSDVDTQRVVSAIVDGEISNARY
jgi:HD superfamily phosphohydrolase